MFRQPPLLRVLGEVVEPEAAEGLVGGAVLPQELQLADRHQVGVFPHLIVVSGGGGRTGLSTVTPFSARFTDLFSGAQRQFYSHYTQYL